MTGPNGAPAPEQLRPIASRPPGQVTGGVRPRGTLNVAAGLSPTYVADVCVRALAESERDGAPRVYVRGGELARTARDENGRLNIQRLDDPTLRTELDRVIQFCRPARGADGPTWKNVTAPIDTVQTVRTQGEWPGIPPLEAIVNAPVLRPDGTVLDAPGYDPPTRLVYDPAPGLEVPPIPAKPARRDAAAALDLLAGDLLGDFPFATQADQANAIALLLTPIIRPALAAVPLALITAPTRGTGKGLLATVTATIATGRPADVYAMPDSDEELGKAIAAMLDSGATVVMLDEVRELRSRNLAAALTADSYTVRRLGRTAMIRVPQRATWIAAGNNITLAGDLDRRCYRIRLDAKASRPWQRNGFKHPDLHAWTLANRGRLIHALLTLARAWHHAGRPAGRAPTLGGFTAWAETTGGILAHAGATGFLDNLTELYEDSNDEANAWEAFLAAAASVYKDTPFRTADLAGAIADDVAGLRGALPPELAAKALSPTFNAILGKALRTRVDTRHGDQGLRVAAAGRDGRTKSPRWQIHADGPAGGAGGDGGCHLPSHTRATPDHVGEGTYNPPQTPAPPAPLIEATP